MTASSKSRLQRQLNLQRTVTQVMLSSLELEPILHTILIGITHVEGLNFDRGFLFLSDETNRELHVQAAVGPLDRAQAQQIFKKQQGKELNLASLMEAYLTTRADPQAQVLAKRLASFVVPVGASAPTIDESDQNVPLQGLVARCAALREPFSSNTIRAVFEPPPASGDEVLSMKYLAAVPLSVRDSTVGVILVDNTYNGLMINEDMMRSVVTLGNLASIAIEKTRLQKMLEETIALDSMTGVFNRRHFEGCLDREVGSARRESRPLALLVFHVNQFKKCNQAHGHQCGDRILQDVAALLKERIRTEDFIARYGEDEFVVMLTGGATKQEAFKVAEKLRTQLTGQGLGGLRVGEVTVSCGVVWIPSEDLGEDALSCLVDEALDRTKKEGHNCVVLIENS